MMSLKKSPTRLTMPSVGRKGYEAIQQTKITV